MQQQRQPTQHLSDTSQQPSDNSVQSDSQLSYQISSTVLDEQEQEDLEWSISDDSDDDGVQDDLDPQEVFDDWMLTTTREQRKMLSVLLYHSFQKRQKMGKMDAAQLLKSRLLLLVSVITDYAFRYIGGP